MLSDDSFRKFLLRGSLVPFFLALLLHASAQEIQGVVNTYTPVIGYVETCPHVLQVEDATGFSEGDRVIVIQMKGAQINGTNSSDYGLITDIGAAGNFEFASIESVQGNEILLENSLINIYEIDGLVQLVLVPQYEDVTVGGELVAIPWNGSTGGVIALEISGTLNLAANINANACGFEGGAPSLNFYQNGNCATEDYFFLDDIQLGAYKGEGISVISQTITGRGAPANGGGGANNLNAGGGGGANFGAGGLGGREWNGCEAESVGGIGGNAIDFQNKVFLGGGGGGGHQNNTESTPGAAGGGIIIIRASEVVSNGFSILANGGSVEIEATIDGAGGGGGGGSIILDTELFSDQVLISAKGGQGGDVNNNFTGGSPGAQCHGPGGGGGGGLVAFTSPLVPVNAISNVDGGLAGLNVNPQSSCQGESYGALAGDSGGVLSEWNLLESDLPVETIINLSGPDLICEGDCAEISVSQASDFSWSPEQSLSETDVANPVACISQNTTFTVIGTDLNGCPFEKSLFIEVVPTLINNFDISICGEDSVFLEGAFQNTPGLYLDTLTAVSGCDSILVFELSVTDLFLLNRELSICDGDSVFLQNDFQSSTGQYTDTLISEFECDTIIVTDLTVKEIPSSTLETSICEGDSIFMNNTYQSQSGTYVDTLTTTSGCDSLVFNELSVIQLPVLSGLGAEILPCEEAELFVFGAASYEWEPDSTLSCIHCSNPFATPELTTVYYYTGSSGGCEVTDSVQVVVADFDLFSGIQIPNVFSPNGDGRNDFFKPTGGDCLRILETQIYNRWGLLVFEGSVDNLFWDGSDANEGVYYYIIKFRGFKNRSFEDRTFTGEITLMR